MENLIFWLGKMVFLTFALTVVALFVLCLVLGRYEWRGYVDIFADDEKSVKRLAKMRKKVEKKFKRRETLMTTGNLCSYSKEGCACRPKTVFHTDRAIKRCIEILEEESRNKNRKR